MITDPSSIKLSSLNEFLSRTCKQYDKIYLDCMMDRKKLSDFAGDDRLVDFGDIRLAENTIEMYALEDSDDRPEIECNNGMTVCEFLSIIAYSLESGYHQPVIFIVYPDGEVDKVNKRTHYEDIMCPNAMINTIDIWNYEDKNDYISSAIPKIVITTKE